MTVSLAKRVKIASVSMNQIVYDLGTNLRNYQNAISKAVEDKADILATEELSVVGYPADDYHQWNKTNDVVWDGLMFIAGFAASLDPNLVVTAGVPWHYADKSKPASDPEYNITNRPYNVHAIITGGRVVAMSAKSILADGAAEYESRQFANWPAVKGTIDITLPDGSVVPFGKPVVALGDAAGCLTLTNEICADAWPGLHDDLSVNVREQTEVRHIIALARTRDLSIVLNPSASKPQPALNKERIRAEGLCRSGSKHCGVYVYTNFLGSASGTYAAEGSQLFAQGDKIVHHGQRYSFQDVSYSSAVVDLASALRGQPDVEVSHRFIAHPAQARTGQEAAFDTAYALGLIDGEQLVFEEYMRSIALWLRDYLAKPGHNPQGYVVSLSGGKDSGYGALAVTTMIDLDVQENGVEGFFRRFAHLACKDDVLKIYAAQGEAAAVRAIKKNVLTCVYLPTENSSVRTQNAARFLIEGGSLPDGTQVEGIGGKFFVAPVQAALDEVTLAFTGLNLDQVVRDNLAEIINGPAYQELTALERFDLGRAKLLRQIKAYTNATPETLPSLPAYVTRSCINPLATWAKAADDLTLQNIQTRVRLPFPWAIANQERKMPLVTSNESEAVHGYTAAGGDMHMGGANPIGGVPKHAITRSLSYFETYGLTGLGPVRSLYWINAETASAELRRVLAGAPVQTDESDLGFTYEQSQYIEELLIAGRSTPTEVFQTLRGNPIYPQDPVTFRSIILGFARRWEAGQFKRIMSPLAPHVGPNADPHQAVRTTVLGDHFHTGSAHMTLDILAECAGSPKSFAQKYGMSLAQAKSAATINPAFKADLIGQSFAVLSVPQHWAAFAKENNRILRCMKPARLMPPSLHS